MMFDDELKVIVQDALRKHEEAQRALESVLAEVEKRKGQTVQLELPQESPKRCAYCGQKKPLSDFNIKRSSLDGRQPYCRDCQKKHNLANRERKSLRGRIRRLNRKLDSMKGLQHENRR